MDYIDILLRLLVAMALGLLLGLERVYAHKTAGMRTYALVAMATALFVIIAIRISEVYLGEVSSDGILRVIAGAITGIGFLGAGLIIFKDNHVKNLTTAAGLWMAGGLGLAAGAGLYFEAVIGTFLSFFVLFVLGHIEHKIKERVGESED